MLKAYMNSDIPLQTAAIFFVTNLYLKQGIGTILNTRQNTLPHVMMKI